MKILITERFLPEAEIKLKKLGYEVKRSAIYAKPTQEEISCIDIAVIRSKTQIHSKLLEKAKNLRLLITLTSGFDHIDVQACKKYGVQWTHTPYANRVSTGELTIALALQSLRHLYKIHKTDILSNHASSHRSAFVGYEIYQKTWGILGLGRIGSYVAKLAKGFGAHILAYDPYITDKDFKNSQAQRVSLIELFRCSDIVSVHVPQTKETHQMVTLNLLKDLGPYGLFINMARKHILATDVLLTGLKQKCVGMVALDVFDTSDVLKAQILKFPNVVLSPHLGGATKEASERASYKAVEIIQQFSKNCDFKTNLVKNE